MQGGEGQEAEWGGEEDLSCISVPQIQTSFLAPLLLPYSLDFSQQNMAAEILEDPLGQQTFAPGQRNNLNKHPRLPP